MEKGTLRSKGQLFCVGVTGQSIGCADIKGGKGEREMETVKGRSSSSTGKRRLASQKTVPLSNLKDRQEDNKRYVGNGSARAERF